MNLNINFGEILSKSWKIILKFKILWIFGILAGCGARTGASYNYNLNSADFRNSNWFSGYEFSRAEYLLRQFWNQAWTRYAWLIWLFVILLIVMLLLRFALGVIGKTALIKGASRADSGAETLRFAQLWRDGTFFFWRMTGLKLVFTLPFWIIDLILLAGMLFSGYMLLTSNLPPLPGIGIFTFFLMLLCVMWIFSILVNWILEQSSNALVIEDLGIAKSIARGWEVFKKAWLSIIAFSIILAVLSFIVSIVVAIPIILVAIPLVFAAATRLLPAGWIISFAVGGSVILFPVILIIMGLLQAYIQTVWTLVFIRITVPSSAVSNSPTDFQGNPLTPNPLI